MQKCYWKKRRKMQKNENINASKGGLEVMSMGKWYILEKSWPDLSSKPSLFDWNYEVLQKI